HVCNDVGGWGRGFVLAISKRWREPELRYRAWHRGEETQPFALGEVQCVHVSQDIWVANLIGQRDIRTMGGVPPIRYEAVREGLKKVAAEAKRMGASVHMPRIGCGLAGGKWEEVERIVAEQLDANGIAVNVYDLAPTKPAK
ncbi:MAG TPA: Appr-1-p processing protein, partial [Verrucomicrobiae bacterium]